MILVVLKWNFLFYTGSKVESNTFTSIIKGGLVVVTLMTIMKLQVQMIFLLYIKH